MSCGEQFRALEDGKLDLGFVGLHAPIARRGLEFRAIASYKTLVALPKDNPLAGKTTVELKALASNFFIGMSEASYPGYREWLTKTCEAAGFTPKVLQDVDLERTMIQAVAAGLGVALVPEQLKKLEHENVVFRLFNSHRLGQKAVSRGGARIHRLPYKRMCKSSSKWAAASVDLRGDRDLGLLATNVATAGNYQVLSANLTIRSKSPDQVGTNSSQFRSSRVFPLIT